MPPEKDRRTKPPVAVYLFGIESFYTKIFSPPSLTNPAGGAMIAINLKKEML